jgi:hypothetical protein
MDTKRNCAGKSVHKFVHVQHAAAIRIKPAALPRYSVNAKSSRGCCLPLHDVSELLSAEDDAGLVECIHNFVLG